MKQIYSIESPPDKGDLGGLKEKIIGLGNRKEKGKRKK